MARVRVSPWVKRHLAIALAVGSWLTASAVRAQSMVHHRTYHAMARLADGRVLVAGGEVEYGASLASAELFAGGHWSPAASMSEPRSSLTLTVMGDGRVLAAGGRHQRQSSAHVEIFDPTSGAWTGAASMSSARSDHVAVLLADGRVLVAGGEVFARPYWLATAELYDPRTNEWTSAGEMSQGRIDGSAARLGDGRVMVTGASGARVRSDTVELYDPRINSWTTLAPPLGQLEGVVAMPDGRALLLGHGSPGRRVADSSDPRAALFDPRDSTWSDGGGTSATSWARGASMVVRADGSVVVAAGLHWRFPSEAARQRAEAEACEGVHVPTVSTTDVWIWRQGVWREGPRLRQARSGAAAVLLEDGARVMLTGGELLQHRGEGTLARCSIERIGGS